MTLMISISSVRRGGAALAAELPIAACLVALDAGSRLLPHASNFTPLAASAVFAGMMFRSRALAIATPISAMLLSDFVVGLSDWRIMSAVYISLALPAVFGIWGRRFGVPVMLAPVVLSSSLLFFATTNFAVWAFSGMYTGDFAGLVRCYVAALPFLHNGVMGDIFWTIILFGGWYIIKHTINARHVYRRSAVAAV
jgi:uncharacterized protein DUF6580